MKQSIIRVAKIKTKGAATGKTKHNYRLMDTPNADPERTASLNQEYINHEQKDYWTLAEQRIEGSVIRKVRDDQVRAMEILLTASPEWFPRDSSGQVPDMRAHPWVQDNLDFLQAKYGSHNVVSFTFHQDEKTPHIHAVVIPITENGRLSADTLFNPKSLKQLQTDYARAMSHHGLERGMEGSRRPHQDMKQVYGRQEATVQEMAPLTQARAVEPFTLETPPLIGRDAWREAQEAKINAEIARQVAEVTKRLEEAVSLAVAQAGAKEQAKHLEERLRKSEGLNQRNYEVALTLQESLKGTKEKIGLLAVDLVNHKDPNPDTVKLANQVLAEGEQRVLLAAQESTKQPFLNKNEVFTRIEQHGFRVSEHVGKEGPVVQVEEVKTGLQYSVGEVFPHLDTQLAYHKQQHEQAQRKALASAPGARQVGITGQPGVIEQIKAAFVRQGANLWDEQKTGESAHIKVSYQQDYQTIEKINKIITKSQSDPRVSEVFETDKDRDARREAIRFLSTPLGQDLHGKNQVNRQQDLERD